MASDIPAAAFTNISPEENEAELAFAIAAGDIPAEPSMPSGLHEGLPQSNASGMAMGATLHAAANTMETWTGDDESTTEQHTTTSSEGLVQTNLRDWLV